MSKIERLALGERAWLDTATYGHGVEQKALRIIDALTAELEAAERKAESWERGHDYAWAEKVKAEARAEALQARDLPAEVALRRIAEVLRGR